MTEYRRTWHPGATWFFTVNLAERRGNRLLVERIDVLRTAFRNVRARHPFQRQGSNASDAVLFVHRILRVLGSFLSNWTRINWTVISCAARNRV